MLRKALVLSSGSLHGSFFFFFDGTGKKGIEYFSLLIVYKHKKNTMLRAKEMNSEMNICSPKAF